MTYELPAFAVVIDRIHLQEGKAIKAHMIWALRAKDRLGQQDAELQEQASPE